VDPTMKRVDSDREFRRSSLQPTEALRGEEVAARLP
jgi:hypothetical protein